MDGVSDTGSRPMYVDAATYAEARLESLERNVNEITNFLRNLDAAPPAPGPAPPTP
ncbi:hypothetical protein GGH13_009876, partial [Coemansia sp. S155-1]